MLFKNIRISSTVLLGVALFFLIFLFVRGYSDAPRLNGDNSIIYGTARSLSESGSYIFNYRPQTRFPPAVPWSLVFLERIGLNQNSAIQVLMEIFFAAGILVFYRLLKIEKESALFSSLLALTTPSFLFLATGGLTTDLPYLLLSALFLFFLSPEKNLNQTLLPFPLRLLIALPLGCFVIMTRTIGVAFIPAIGLYLLFLLVHRRNRNVQELVLYSSVLFAMILTQLSWSRWKQHHLIQWWEGEFMVSYERQLYLRDPHHPLLGAASLQDFFTRVLQNTVINWTHIGEMIFRITWLDPWTYSPLVIFPSILICLGWLDSFRQPILQLSSLYVVCYLVILLLWPFDEGHRFLFPVAPLLFFYFWLGIKRSIPVFQNTVFQSTGIRSQLQLIAGIGVAALSAISISGKHGFQSIASIGFWASTIILYGMLFTPAQFLIVKVSRKLFRYFWKASVACAASIILVGAIQSWIQNEEMRGKRSFGYQHDAGIDAAYWLSKNAAKDDVSMAASFGPEPIIHYLTGMKVIPTPVLDNAESLISIIDNLKVRWLVVVDDPSHPYFFPTEEEKLGYLLSYEPDRFVEKLRGGKFRIFEIITRPSAS